MLNMPMDILLFHYDMVWTMIRKRISKKIAIPFGISALLLPFLYKYYKEYRVKHNLRVKQEEVRTRINRLRQKLLNSNLNDDVLLNLTKLNLSELHKRIEDGQLKPTDLLQAFQLKALQLYDKGNSGICEFLLEADEAAEALDGVTDPEARKNPLFGIPISIKESFLVKGYDSTLGLSKLCNAPNLTTAPIVQALRDSGAVPFVLTCTTQANRSLEGFNPVFGNVVNPYGASHVTGGSSSGEAVILAQFGSPVGIGSDIGGSVRIPAAFCGLASLKPTLYRLSSLGMSNIASRSVLELAACPGPMGRNVDDVSNVMRVLLSDTLFKLDHRVIPLPFDDDAFNGVGKDILTIGFYDTLLDDDVGQTVPSVRNVVRKAVNALIKQGHHVVPFHPPKPSQAYHLVLRSIFADGGREYRSWMAFEPQRQSQRYLGLLLGLPYYMKFACSFILKLFNCGPMAVTHLMGGFHNTSAFFDHLIAVRTYKKEFQDAWDSAGPLDAVVCPASAFPAPPGATRSIIILPSFLYTAMYNLIDYPAGTVPMNLVDHRSLVKTDNISNTKPSWYESQVAGIQETSEGLPLAVQVVGKPFREETVLRVMRIIESHRDAQ